MTHIHIDQRKVADLCRRWKVETLALFGSVLRDDFRPNSDVDVLVDFQRDAQWDLFDLVTLREELSALVGRPVDLVERQALVNPFRRREILEHLETLYAA
jgi:uncharacterized protein